MTRLGGRTKLIDIYKIQGRIDYFEKLRDEIDLYMQIWRPKCLFTLFWEEDKSYMKTLVSK